ncbi:hypothetical protein LCGC14_1248670 [marine sediment metagenome]|uniref:Uncharacterized protein n=1 Tax=marine sediment metagenome TaxID=412755 RepID=A0A0F9L3N2_9ZZZZ
MVDILIHRFKSYKQVMHRLSTGYPQRQVHITTVVRRNNLFKTDKTASTTTINNYNFKSKRVIDIDIDNGYILLITILIIER